MRALVCNRVSTLVACQPVENPRFSRFPVLPFPCRKKHLVTRHRSSVPRDLVRTVQLFQLFNSKIRPRFPFPISPFPRKVSIGHPSSVIGPIIYSTVQRFQLVQQQEKPRFPLPRSPFPEKKASVTRHRSSVPNLFNCSTFSTSSTAK